MNFLRGKSAPPKRADRDVIARGTRPTATGEIRLDSDGMEVLHQGELKKRGQNVKSWKMRYFKLEKTKLTYLNKSGLEKGHINFTEDTRARKEKAHKEVSSPSGGMFYV